MQKAIKYLPALAGILFGVAWFFWIDGHVYENTYNRRHPDAEGPRIQWVFYLPGIFSTVGMVMANIVDLSALSNGSFLEDGGATKVRIWLFVSFAINFGCIAAAVWIMAALFMPPHNSISSAQWPGIAITVQNVLIFISSLLLVYKRSRNDDEFQSF
ncbi:hypothetical protein DICPUDRAFT_52137 [Dictyostelium purpureum]|uniref:Transmembrane protein n=1 Tax=Dictyostelium purpureum TaxID=5786 RepID=F0Z776_DICPU|nr:uncharacterized protein DICPUDRAFT_52137 [Dictyostelium purpureum]EGC40196.1 hypothetical protein DICPUDRAFT_52137 [Dictyostelium purpureum]|eukprot:XP_003283265.1 hypothetical protein DICPUDRAFT_52137 [Dictyostelium purpureum]